MYVRNGYDGDSETVNVLARYTALKRWIATEIRIVSHGSAVQSVALLVCLYCYYFIIFIIENRTQGTYKHSWQMWNNMHKLQLITRKKAERRVSQVMQDAFWRSLSAYSADILVGALSRWRHLCTRLAVDVKLFIHIHIHIHIFSVDIHGYPHTTDAHPVYNVM